MEFENNLSSQESLAGQMHGSSISGSKEDALFSRKKKFCNKGKEHDGKGKDGKVMKMRNVQGVSNVTKLGT